MSHHVATFEPALSGKFVFHNAAFYDCGSTAWEFFTDDMELHQIWQDIYRTIGKQKFTTETMRFAATLKAPAVATRGAATWGGENGL
jgi:hypothetical protein